MSWLLKIVDGPLKGAEIALLGGRRTSVGSDDSCDLVIADQSLAAKAFELDVSETAVTLLVEGGEAKALRPFEVHAFGTTSVAVGPAEGAWQPLVYPKAEEPKADEPKAEDAGQEEKSESAEAVAPPVAEGGDGTEKKKGRHGLGCLVWLLALLLLGLAIWWFWPRIVERFPQAEQGKTVVVTHAKTWSASAWAWARAKFEKPEPVIVKGPSLAEIADQYALALTPAAEGVRATLAGNVRLRTERLAIRALALADDPTVRLDLTDDETLRTSANELLFVVTEGALKAVAASNRMVTLTGYAPTAAKLELAVRALAKDVAAIERLDTTRVRVGGTPPQEVAQTAFAEAKPAAKSVAATPKKAVPRHDYPIAGILTKPYPCVVMRNGLRVCEGAQVGTAVVVSIGADRLVLKEGGHQFEWRP